MKRHLTLLVLVALAAALCVPPAWSQATATVKGYAKDNQGQPLVGATVEFVNQDTGQKYDIKTNKKGEYFSLGIASGKYKVSLLNNGQTLFFFNGVQISLANEENTLNFDLQKEAAAAFQDIEDLIHVKVPVNGNSRALHYLLRAEREVIGTCCRAGLDGDGAVIAKVDEELDETKAAIEQWHQQSAATGTSARSRMRTDSSSVSRNSAA